MTVIVAPPAIAEAGVTDVKDGTGLGIVGFVTGGVDPEG